jgi:anti-sigma B factor antagonist
MDYLVKEEDQRATIFLEGELDMSVGEKVGSLIREYGLRNQTLDIDFAAVTFVDSAGIGSLFYATKELLAAGKQVEIIHVQEEIYDILRVLGFAEALGVSLHQAE